MECTSPCTGTLFETDVYATSCTASIAPLAFSSASSASAFASISAPAAPRAADFGRRFTACAPFFVSSPPTHAAFRYHRFPKRKETLNGRLFRPKAKWWKKRSLCSISGLFKKRSGGTKKLSKGTMKSNDFTPMWRKYAIIRVYFAPCQRRFVAKVTEDLLCRHELWSNVNHHSVLRSLRVTHKVLNLPRG